MSEQTNSEATAENDELRVSKVVDHPLKSVWQALLTDDGNEALLGPGARLTEKGQNWQAEDGTHGVTRSFHPMEEIRFTFHRSVDRPGSIVDVRLKAVDDASTEIEIVHSKLPEDFDPEWLQKHWSDALERIASDAL